MCQQVVAGVSSHADTAWSINVGGEVMVRQIGSSFRAWCGIAATTFLGLSYARQQRSSEGFWRRVVDRSGQQLTQPACAAEARSRKRVEHRQRVDSLAKAPDSVAGVTEMAMSREIQTQHRS